MIKNAATTKAASNTSPGLLLLFYITIGTLPKKDEIRATIQANISQEQAFLIRSLLSSIDAVAGQIAEIDVKVSELFSRKDDLRIAMHASSVKTTIPPGIVLY